MSNQSLFIALFIMQTTVVTASYETCNEMEKRKLCDVSQILNCKPQTQTHCCKSNEIFSTEQEEESSMQLFHEMYK